MLRALLPVVLVVLSGCKEEPRSCTKMKALCGAEIDSCKGMRESLREDFGNDAVDKLDGCFLSASTCAEATGCATGAALKATGEAAKEFLDGLAKELEK